MDSDLPRDCPPWTPGLLDTGQVDECTCEEAAFNRVCAGLSEDQVCMRAFRALEIERVMSELCRAAAMARHDFTQALPYSIDDDPVDDWAACTIATLNLMGIETLLPGETPLDVADTDSERARIHLSQPTGECWIAGALDQRDALSGLIRDFHRSTIFANGLRLVPSEVGRGVVQWSLESAHPGIIVGFGEYLMQKYITEGWRLA